MSARPLPEELRLKLRSAIPKSSRSIFGRQKRKEGDIGYVAAWGVFVHARRSDLLSEVPQIRGGKRVLMLTANQLRQVASRSGASDIGNVEIDVILTYLLQLFAEKGITAHVAFKGGTMLRKMVFGPRGRLSTDLDFTCRTDIGVDDLMLMMLEAVEHPYHGISFRFDRDKDWYLTDEGCAANPVCAHAGNEKGMKIKLQVSMRERPVLAVHPRAQLALDHFKLLEFEPAAIPSLAFEEAVAEKIRAASQRSKIRDLHDLSEIAVRAA